MNLFGQAGSGLHILLTKSANVASKKQVRQSSNLQIVEASPGRSATTDTVCVEDEVSGEVLVERCPG